MATKMGFSSVGGSRRRRGRGRSSRGGGSRRRPAKTT